LIVYTGGTIGMMHDPVSKVLMPLDFSRILARVPELDRLDYSLSIHSFDPIIDSSNVNPEIWLSLAKLIRDNYEAYDGFVILHGSDTMAYSASMLSFLFRNLTKPVIFTGSQLPIGEIRTDAKENLITAIEIAASKNGNKARVPEVCIYFDYKLFRGNRARKYNSQKFEAFHSPNYPLLAEAGVNLNYNSSNILNIPEGAFRVHEHLDTNLNILKIFPGISSSTVDSITSTKGLRAIVMETFGSGNTTTAAWFLKSLEKTIQKGIIIVDISQCEGGSVDMGRYETSRYLKEMGIVSGFDMTFEATVTKLMFLLGHNYSTDTIRNMIETPLRGELSRN
jgi:L-asparaginase